jgi:hypothetical protein
MLCLPGRPFSGGGVVAKLLAKVIAGLLADRRPLGLGTPGPGKFTHQRTDRGPLLGGQLGQPCVRALINFDHLDGHNSRYTTGKPSLSRTRPAKPARLLQTNPLVGYSGG